MSLRSKQTEDKAKTENETPEVDETALKEVATKPASEVVVGGSSVFITNPDFLDAVADATYGTFKSVVASNGTHMISGSDIDLGKILKFQAIVAKDVWKVTPGSSDEESKDYFKVSNDGEVTNDGQDINEALQDALDAGYSKAKISKYVDVICLIVECGNDDFIGETITLQLAPSSQFTWGPLAGKCKMAKAMGRLKSQPIAGDPELGSAVIFVSTATPTSWKGNSFTKLEFALDK